MIFEVNIFSHVCTSACVNTCLGIKKQSDPFVTTLSNILKNCSASQDPEERFYVNLFSFIKKAFRKF